MQEEMLQQDVNKRAMKEMCMVHIFINLYKQVEIMVNYEKVS